MRLKKLRTGSYAFNLKTTILGKIFFRIKIQKKNFAVSRHTKAFSFEF
jgi:hypothetical protein